MKKTILVTTTLSCLFTITASAESSLDMVIKALSVDENASYTIVTNPSTELNLQSTHFSVTLPDGTTQSLEFNNNELSDTSGTLFLRDQIGTTRGTISITRDGNTFGSIETLKGQFNLIGHDQNMIVIESKLPTGIHETAENEFRKAIKQPTGLLALSAQLSDLEIVSHTQDEVLRLSLYYTNDTKRFLNEINVEPKQYFDFYVDNANQAYKNSDINIHIEIANITPINYDEYNSFFTTLDFWLNDGDNFNKLTAYFPDTDRIWMSDAMDKELKNSKKYGSDMDMLIINPRSGYCGIAQIIGAEVREQSMAITNVHCLQKRTLPHEMGHLFGAEHNWESTVKVPYQALYAHGYYDAEDWSFRTIMSYSCIESAGGPKECPRINYFSTPRKEFNGKYIGTVDEHDNARQHNDWAPMLTNLSKGADCSQFKQWDLNKAYKKGDETSHNGVLYRANWWNYNDNPTTTSSKSEWKEVWQILTQCK